MSFAMRVNFVDVVCDNSLKNEYINGQKAGYSFDIRLSYYRGHFLSDIDVFEVEVDGETVKPEDVAFCINGKEFAVYELREAYTEFWRLLDPAKIKVYHLGGLFQGRHHIKIKLMMRVPYLPLPGGVNEHTYMPLDACGEKTLEIQEAGGGQR